MPVSEYRHRPADATATERRTAAATRPQDRTGRGRHDGTEEIWLDHVIFAERRDPAALDRLVAEYERYARSLAARLHRRNEPREDLDQVALEALVVALQRFDPHRGVPFVAFANPTILGALRRHYRDRGWLLRVPRYVHDLTTKATATNERLRAEYGRAPTHAEVADALHIAIEDLLAAQEASFARCTVSLDASAPGGATAVSERVGAVDRDLTTSDDRLDLGEALADIDPPDRELLRLYFFEDRTQVEIGRILGISQMQVSRRLAKTLHHLRGRMAAA